MANIEAQRSDPSIKEAPSPVVEERRDSRTEITDKDPIAKATLGFAFPTAKKWWILTVIFWVQISMNYNAAIYANAVPGMAKEFGITPFQARLGQMAFLVAYGFGCEFWAPFSEELGRKWIMQVSLGLVNLFQLPCMLSTGFGTVLAGRIMGGLSSAGGSVTLGMVADMFGPEDQQFAMLYVVFSSCAGSVVAPIIGGFMTQYADWRWVFYSQLIFGAVVQLAHLIIVPETRATVLLDREAQRRRKSGEEPDVYGPREIRGNFWQRLDCKHVLRLMWRPYQFLLTEPVVAFLSLLSGFSDALIFTGLDSFALVLSKWNFTPSQVGLSFVSLLLGYVLSCLFFIPFYINDRRAMRAAGGEHGIKPERRMKGLLWLILLEPIGLAAFGATSLGPPEVHWIAPLIFVTMIGIANLAIYQATCDYMVAAYGEYSASATGGNGFCRDFLAGIAALYATPLYSNIKPGTKWQLPIPSFMLAAFAVPLVIAPYIFYFHGEWFRSRSKYASQLAEKRAEEKEN
ncbi:hypothetical protein WHR41_07963 [Cladosporium halotolerans]|uniref:Major facilitator superfamily (MFS) profile domain-containing protein n=1 Tax=Cladosporium halotolerans TaxID=1052096 RepID=A0AB34KDR7_9PEZI